MLNVVVDRRVGAGGVGRYAATLVSGLRELDDVVVREIADEGFLLKSFTPWGRWAAARRARSGGLDVFHSLHLEVPRGLWPAVVTIHDLIPLELEAAMPSAARRWVFRRTVQTAIERAERVVVPSELTKGSLLRAGFDAGRVRVIPNGISDLFRPAADDARAAARIRFGGGRPYVAALANRRAHKNVAVLGSVGPLLDTEGLKLVVASGLSDRDLVAFLGGSEAFVFPSLREGFGYPVAEAVACGTPVVCGPDLGVVPYLPSVVVVDARDPQALASAVVGVVADPILRAETVARGVTEVARLSVRTMVAETVDVYGEVAAAR